MKKVVIWNNRTPKTWLVLIDKEGVIHRFQGMNIPGVTIERLSVPKDMQVFMGDGLFLEGVATTLQLEQKPSTWALVASTLRVQEGHVRSFLHRFFPREADELDRVESKSTVQEKPVKRWREFQDSYI